MSSDGKPQTIRLAAILREPAGFLRKPRPPLLLGYSDAWKAVCREILLIYMDVSKGSRRKKVPSIPDLRELIMEPYERDGPDERLNRHNLYDWLKGRSIIGDEAFAFIDDFVRHIQYADPNYAKVLSDLIGRRDLEVSSALRCLYTTHGGACSDETVEIFKKLSTVAYVSEPRPVDLNTLEDMSPIGDFRFSQIALGISDLVDGVATAKAVYSRSLFAEINDMSCLARSEYRTYYGYAVAIEDIHGNLERIVLLLFREQVRGISPTSFQTSSILTIISGYPNGTPFHNGFPSHLDAHDNYSLVRPTLHSYYKALVSDVSSGLGLTTNGMSFDALLEDNIGLAGFIRNLTNGYLLW